MQISHRALFWKPRKKVEMEMKIIAVHTASRQVDHPHGTIIGPCNHQPTGGMFAEPPANNSTRSKVRPFKEGSPHALGNPIEVRTTSSCIRIYTGAGNDLGVYPVIGSCLYRKIVSKTPAGFKVERRSVLYKRWNKPYTSNISIRQRVSAHLFEDNKPGQLPPGG